MWVIVCAYLHVEICRSAGTIFGVYKGSTLYNHNTFFFCWVSSCLVIVKLLINIKMSKMTQKWATLAEKWQSHTNAKQMNFTCNFITCQHTRVWAHLFIESVLWRSWYLLKRMDLSQDPAAYRKLRDVFILFFSLPELCSHDRFMLNHKTHSEKHYRELVSSRIQVSLMVWLFSTRWRYQTCNHYGHSVIGLTTKDGSQITTGEIKELAGATESSGGPREAI